MTERVHTYAAGQQVLSANFNTWQDKGIVISENLDQLAGRTTLFKTATCNQDDSPAPDTFGGRLLDVDEVTNGTTEVVLDTGLDYRDRFVTVFGVLQDRSVGPRPGEASDEECRFYNFTRRFYAQEGNDGTLANPGLQEVPGTGYWRLYARDTDGALCMRLTDAGDPQQYFSAHLMVGPKRNQYSF